MTTSREPLDFSFVFLLVAVDYVITWLLCPRQDGSDCTRAVGVEWFLAETTARMIHLGCCMGP